MFGGEESPVESSSEQKKVVDIEWAVEGDYISWWKMYEGGIEDYDNRGRMEARPDNKEAALQELRRIRKENGLNEEA